MDSTNYQKGHSKFSFILIGASTMVCLTGQSWHVLKSWYMGGVQNKNFCAVSKMLLTGVRLYLQLRLLPWIRSTHDRKLNGCRQRLLSHASSHSKNVASARRVAKNSHLYGNSSYTSLIIIISSVGQTTANSAVLNLQTGLNQRGHTLNLQTLLRSIIIIKLIILFVCR